jgi:hypothetical protein
MSTMRTLTILTLLLSALPALAAEPSEHWRCGPYDVRIVPGDSYVPGEYIVLDDDAGFVVRRNGRDAGHFRADERGGNIRQIFITIESPAYMDISVFNDSVSATIALIAPRLSKEERETTTYMIVHSVMDKTRNEQALNEFTWILDFGFPQTTFIVFGRSRNSWK